MKNLLSIILTLFVTFTIAAQTEPTNIIVGGRRISSDCKGTGNPNTILGNQFGEYECTNFTDTVSGKIWKYVPTATPNKWIPVIDSAGNYMNQNRLGIIDLGGTGEIQNTYLNMGTVADNRVFRLGELGVTYPFGYVLSRGASGGFGEVELFLKDATKDIYWDVWERGLESRFRRNVTTPFNQVLRQSRDYPTIVGNLSTIYEHQLSDGDFKMNGGFTAGVRENTNLTTATKEQGAEVDLFLYRKAHDGSFPASSWSLRNQDTLNNAGTVLKRQNFIAGHYIPNGSGSSSMTYSLIMGKYDNSWDSYEKDANLGGYDIYHNVAGTGERFSIRQHKYTDLSNPSLFEWFGIGEFDGTETGNKVSFYGKYALPNATPSITNGDKQTIVWTGNSVNAVPAFENVGLSSGVVENGIQYVGSKIGLGGTLVRNTTINAVAYSYSMTNSTGFSVYGSGSNSGSIVLNNTGPGGVKLMQENVLTNNRGLVVANSGNFSYIGNDNTASGSTGVVQTFSSGQVDLKAFDGGANTRTFRVLFDKFQMVGITASSGGTFTKQLVLDPATEEVRMEDKSLGGIYGPNGTLDANGHVVTIPDGINNYLKFNLNNAAGNTRGIRSVANENATNFADHFITSSPSDSFMIRTRYGGTYLVYEDGGSGFLNIGATSPVSISSDSTSINAGATANVTISPVRLLINRPIAITTNSAQTVTEGGTYTPINTVPFHRLSANAGAITAYTITLPASAPLYAEYEFHFEGTGTGASILGLTWNPPAGQTIENVGFALPSPKPGVTYKWKLLTGSKWALTGCSGCGL